MVKGSQGTGLVLLLSYGSGTI